MFFSLIKEINRSVSKGMSSIYYSEKLTFSKFLFSRKENLKKCTSFKEQKGTSYIRGNVYFDITVLGCLSSTKACLRFYLICFAREIEGFYQSSIADEFDFRDIMDVSSNIFAKKLNFKKLRHGFVDEIAMITTTLIPSSYWKTLSPFSLRKKRPETHIFNTNSELSQNCTEKQIMPFKTTVN